MTIVASMLQLVLLCLAFSIPPPAALAAESENAGQAGSADAPAASVTPEQTAEAKTIFAAQCGWCHGSYGMTADKAPRLAGTQMTERQVEERIRNGKPGYMPSFHRFLNDDQIALMARYIKSLRPQN